MNDKKIIDYYNYLTALLAIFPILKLNYGSVLMIFWSIFSIIIAIKFKSRLTKRDIFDVTILSFLFLIYIFSFLFVEDKKNIIALIKKALPFGLFPLFMILNKNHVYRKTLDYSLTAFVLSNLCLTIYSWLKIYTIGLNYLQSKNDFYNPVFRNIFSDSTGIHLPYLGIFFSFSAFIALVRITKKGNIIKPIIYTFIFFIFIVSLIVFAARMALLCLFISILCFLLFKFKTKKIYKISFIGILSIFFFIAINVKPLKERIQETFATENILPHKGQTPEEFQVRYGIYHCAKQLIEKNWLFGVGATKVQDKLNECYDQYDYEAYDDYKHVDYNSHNQYLDIFLKFGIFGLILFLISIFWGIRNKNIYYLGFIILFSLCIITENMLVRHLGIVFFTFFNSLFFINKYSKDEKSCSC